MKNLYLIVNKGTNASTVNSLTRAAENKNINIHMVYVDDFDFSQAIQLSNKDGIYRISGGTKAKLIERFLINDEVRSFYKHKNFCLGRIDTSVGCSLIHEKAGLPIIPTIFGLPEKKQIDNYLKKIGEFPIIIKALGRMHGVGVMKIDSKESFVSIVDFLRKQEGDFIIRKFISHTEQARIVVLGNKVISSHANLAGSDFRTNAGDQKTRERELKEYSNEVQNIAVQAVQSLGFEFGGVDILFESETNKPYISEVNYPFFFPGNEKLTGNNIAEQMINHLIQKKLTN